MEIGIGQKNILFLSMLKKLFKQFLSSDVFLLEQQGIRSTCIDFVMANVCGQEHAVGKCSILTLF